MKSIFQYETVYFRKFTKSVVTTINCNDEKCNFIPFRFFKEFINQVFPSKYKTVLIRADSIMVRLPTVTFQKKKRLVKILGVIEMGRVVNIFLRNLIRSQ